MLISTIDKKPPAESSSELTSSPKVHEPACERSPARRLGIRDLPMPPMPSDVDDDVDEDENDWLSEWKKENDLCDSIVKSYVKNVRRSTSPESVGQETMKEYVLLTSISLQY